MGQSENGGSGKSVDDCTGEDVSMAFSFKYLFDDWSIHHKFEYIMGTEVKDFRHAD